MRENYIKNQYAEMWIEGGIVIVSYFELDAVDLQCAIKIYEDRVKISEGKDYPVLAEVLKVKYWTRDARQFQNTPQNYTCMKALALNYTESHVANIILNVFMYVNKPLIPTKSFTNREAAISWLQQFR